MTIKVDQLIDLVTEKSPEIRQTISEISWMNFQQMTNANLKALDQSLRHELLVLTVEAQKICDDFYIWQKEMNATVREKDRTNLIARARLKDNSLTIEWIKQHTYVNKQTGKRFVNSKALTPPRKFKYSAVQWSKQPDWLKPRLASVENELSLIRERVDFLRAIRQAVRAYKDVVIRTRNTKQRELDLQALPIPLIRPRSNEINS